MSSPKRAQGSRRQWWGYTTQFFLITVLPLTALILVGVIASQSLHHDAMRSLVGERDLNAVRAAASSMVQELDQRASILSILGRSLGQAAGEAPCTPGGAGAANTGLGVLPVTPDEIASSFDGGLALFSEGGCLAAVTPGSAATWEGITGQAAGFLAGVQGSEARPVFSQPLAVQGTGGTVLLVAESLGNGRTLAGAFTPAALFERTASTLTSSGTITVMVISREPQEGAFKLLYRAGPQKPDEQDPQHPGIREVLNGESGIRYFQSGRGEHVVSFSPIVPQLGQVISPGGGPAAWGLVIEEAWEDIANPDLRASQYAPLVMVPVILLALAALWFGARRIVQPLQALENRASALAKGDFQAIRQPVGGIGEIRDLQEELVEMAEQLQAAQQNLRSYLGAITAGVENERRSLSRDLHDDTIQSLIVLNQRIQMAMLRAGAEDQKTLAGLQELVLQTMEGLRRTIRGLRPIYLEELGLAAALEMLASETSASSGLRIAFQKEGTERRLGLDKEMTLYRMAQESLSNVVRHAGAEHASLSLAYTPAGLRLEISDDGRGFHVPASPSEHPRQGHFGLIGLHERAELIGARLEISSQPGRGTRVIIQTAE